MWPLKQQIANLRAPFPSDNALIFILYPKPKSDVPYTFQFHLSAMGFIESTFQS